MKLYLCMHTATEILYPEEWPFDTDEQKEWGKAMYNRFVTECIQRGDAAGWIPYASTEKQFAFEEAPE